MISQRFREWFQRTMDIGAILLLLPLSVAFLADQPRLVEPQQGWYVFIICWLAILGAGSSHMRNAAKIEALEARIKAQEKEFDEAILWLCRYPPNAVGDRP